jgi:hypothetical protein
MQAVRHRTALVALAVLAATGLTACSSSSTTSTPSTRSAICPAPGSSVNGRVVTYGPTWGRFTAGFPSKPDVTSALTSELGHAPGSTAACGYAVSSDHQLFSSNSTNSAVPTYETVVVRFKSAADATSYVHDQNLMHATPITVNGATGITLTTVTPGTPSGKSGPTVPAANVGVLAVARAGVVYLAFAATATTAAPPPTASAFVASVTPVS